jgi:hypothetical protein
MRRSMRALTIAITSLATACGDSTGPSTSVELSVPQETMLLIPPGGVYLQWVARNPSRSTVSVGACNLYLQRETAPDVWTTVRTGLDVCLASDLQPGAELRRAVGYQDLTTGYYRLALPWSPKGQGAMEVLAYSIKFGVSG